MTERNPNDELRQEVNSLKSQVQRLNNIVWVVGIVAVIFGIGGGWGAKTLSEAQKTLGSLEDKKDQYLNDLRSDLDEHYAKKKDELLSKLDKHYEEKKKDFALYVKYNDLIALRLPAHHDVLLSGSYDDKIGVRTTTRKIDEDEKWKIVKVP